MKLKINPLLGNIEPSFLHIFSKKIDDDFEETTFTICKSTTTPILIEFLENDHSIFKEKLLPKTIYNQILCVSGQFKKIHKNKIILILRDLNENQIFKIFSDENSNANKSNINIIKSKLPYEQYYFEKPVDLDYSNLKVKFYNRVLLKLKYTYIMIRRLLFVTIKTFINITKYIFTSKLK